MIEGSPTDRASSLAGTDYDRRLTLLDEIARLQRAGAVVVCPPGVETELLFPAPDGEQPPTDRTDR